MNDETERVAEADLAAPEAVGPLDAAPGEADSPPRATANRAAPWPESFAAYIGSGWADRALVTPPQRDQAPYAAERRRRVSAEFPGQRLVVRAGSRKVRSNDTDYPFRADSGFSWLTGWGADAEPDSVLVLDPAGDGHLATLY